MHAPQQPFNNIGGDPRNLLILACHGSNIGSVPVTNKFDAAVAALENAQLYPSHRQECIAKLGLIFQNFIESGNWKRLDETQFGRGLEAAHVEARLDVGLVASKILTIPRVSVREESFREEIAFGSVKDLFSIPLDPGASALREMDEFLKKAPSFVDDVIAFERQRGELPENKDLNPSDIRYVYRANELVAANMKLLIENEMPASALIDITKALLLIKKQSLRDEVIDMWKWFAHSAICSSVVDDNRLPEPLGRAALVAAVKVREGRLRRFDLGEQNTTHQLPVSLPSNPAHWRYFAQRLNYLSTIKDEAARDLRMSAYVYSFREFVAARPFFEQEERFFRGINLDGIATSEAYRFYTDTYGVDNGPGPEGSELAEKPLRETAKAFRFMAAGRYGLNIRKGYTRTIHETGRWLLESMAEELKGESARYRYRDIEAYPGSGLRMWGLDIRNALDLSTPKSRARYIKAAPWIASSLRVGGEVEYHLTRGFKAIARTLDATARPMSRTWEEHGSYNGEPFAALLFNDHFHNDTLPEVRMWLVPERVLHRKLVWAIENNVDINKLDITPEGLAEEADYLGCPIFDVGCSCARWGSFANAWPHATGPAHFWENESSWRYSRWQSPRHIHRAMASERYTETVSKDVSRVMAAARVEHDIINRMTNFFLDLHASFLTMEEAWAKGFANASEDPAQEEPSPEPSEGGAAGGGAEGRSSSDDEALFDFKVSRPRTRMLTHFLQLRNQIVESKRGVKAQDIPSLELQYTRLFARQVNTPYISGSDMFMIFPDGRNISLLGGKSQPGEAYMKKVEMNERIEALWDEYIVSHFAPNNCPRIILP